MLSLAALIVDATLQPGWLNSQARVDCFGSPGWIRTSDHRINSHLDTCFSTFHSVANGCSLNKNRSRNPHKTWLFAIRGCTIALHLATLYCGEFVAKALPKRGRHARISRQSESFLRR